MNLPVEILTHALAAIGGGALTYIVVRGAAGDPPHMHHRTGGDTMHDDDSALEQDKPLTRRQRIKAWLASHRQPPTWLIIVIASLFVTAIGVQAALVQANDRADDRDRATQQVKDRARQSCLNEFAADLVATIKARAEANKEVADAAERKDVALDNVFDLLAANNAAPAKTPKQEAVVRKNFEAAVAERVAAQSALKTAKANAEATLNENPYEIPKTPKAVC